MGGDLHKIKVAFVIDQLRTGGTERQLKYLIDGLDSNLFEVALFLLRGEENHPLKPDHGTVKTLGVLSLLSRDGFQKLYNFSKYLKEEKIEIVQTFSEH